jgi:hypothetical protein
MFLYFFLLAAAWLFIKQQLVAVEKSCGLALDNIRRFSSVRWYNSYWLAVKKTSAN